MTDCLDLYKCNVCGNLVEIVLSGVGELVCCGEPMEYLEAKAQDSEYGEKHVPVVTTINDNDTEIRVGSVLHPMVKEHYIQFIEALSDNKTRLIRQYYYPQEMPIMILNDKSGLEFAREFCNIHGLWSNKLK